jgi:hypothetical protein
MIAQTNEGWGRREKGQKKGKGWDGLNKEKKNERKKREKREVQEDGKRIGKGGRREKRRRRKNKQIQCVPPTGEYGAPFPLPDDLRPAHRPRGEMRVCQLVEVRCVVILCG